MFTKTLLLASCACLPLLTYGQQGTYTIAGQLAPTSTPAKAYLRSVANNTMKVDTAEVKNGVFTFTGTVTEPTMALLLVDQRGVGMRKLRPDQGVSLYLEPGTISVKSPDSTLHAVVSGTPLNTDSQKLRTALKPSTDKMAALMQDYQKATPEQRKSADFDQAMDKRYSDIEREQKQVRTQFIRAMPQSMVSLDAVKASAGMVPDYNEVGPLFDGLLESVKNSRAGKEYATTLASLKATSIGAMAPDFTQADTLGKAVSLRDFKGKYVLVDFWASWCGPCRQENPNVVKNFNQFKDRNFTVLGISLDRPNAKDAWLKAIQKDGLAWTQVSDLKFWDNDVAKLYGVRAIPQNFLIDPTGKIIAKNIRGEELGKKLNELLTKQ